MQKSNFYDFSEKKVTEWKKQAKKFKHVFFYYDEKQKAYCREVKNVPGEIIGNDFVPFPNKIINYKQLNICKLQVV